MMRLRLLTGSALALTLLGAVGGVAQAQTAPEFPIPYDSRRGVFSFATGLERSLPAVVQVTTLGMSAGPTTGETEPTPVSSGSGVIIDAANGISPTEHYVRVACGLDALGASPIRGISYGGGRETMTVALRVRQMQQTQQQQQGEDR